MSKSMIHPTAIVSKKAVIGNNVHIGAYCLIGDHVVLADNVQLHSHVVIEGNTSIGEGTKISSFAVIGTAPQFLAPLQHESRVVIGKNNQIREHVTISMGVEEEGTTIGDDCMIMVSAHVAHDCHIGNKVLLVNNVTLGGHVVVEDYAYVGGLSGIHQKVRLGKGCIIGGLSGVEGDVIPYGSVIGNRARLCGLNLVGLRRRGVDRERIHTLRSAYRLLFADEGTLTERIQDAMELFKEDPVVMEVIEFLQENSKNNARPLCLPR